MKRVYIIAILITICGLTAMAQNRPDMTHQSTGGDRYVFVSDMPSLTFDNEAQEIIVEGSHSNSYAVVITSLPNQVTVLETVINGDYDIIDTSMLSSGSYQIALTSSRGNTYTWTFNGGSLTSTSAPGGARVRTTDTMTGGTNPVLNNLD